jgi:hypothetical protein
LSVDFDLVTTILSVAAIIVALRTIIPELIATPRRLRLLWHNIKTRTLSDIYEELKGLGTRVEKLEAQEQEIRP